MISSQRNTGWATVSTASEPIEQNQVNSTTKSVSRDRRKRTGLYQLWLRYADSLHVRITLLFSALFVCIALYLIDAIFGLWIYDMPGDEQTKAMLHDLFVDVYLQRISTGILLALGMVLTSGVYLRHFTQRNIQPLLKYSQQIASQQTGHSQNQAQLEGYLSGEFRKIGSSMQAMNQQLASYEDQRAALLKRMTHDVRSPLTVIQTLASMHQPTRQSAQGGEGAEELTMEKDWQLVDACAVQLGRLLDDLRYLVGNNAGGAYEPSEHSATDLLTATEQLVGYHEARLGRRGIAFNILMTNAAGLECAPTAEQYAHQIAMDFTRFSQLLGNLIDNAIEHGKATQVDIKMQPIPDDLIRLRVHDNGYGMPDEVQEQMFDEGFTLGADRQGHQGLGLAIVSDIVKAHSGSISVSSSPESGTIFDILLPLRKQDEPTCPENSRTIFQKAEMGQSFSGEEHINIRTLEKARLGA